jgi:hypothetical protein
MIQRSHHATTEVWPHCRLESLSTRGVQGASFKRKLYKTVDRSEPCGVSARTINLFLDTSPSTETFNFLFERIELIGLIKRVGKFNFDNLYSNRGAMLCQRLLRYPRISEPETLLPKSEPISVRKPNALKCRAVM